MAHLERWQQEMLNEVDRAVGPDRQTQIRLAQQYLELSKHFGLTTARIAKECLIPASTIRSYKCAEYLPSLERAEILIDYLAPIINKEWLDEE